MPLTELWDDSGTLTASKICYLDLEEIRDMLKGEPIHFVVATGGDELKWLEQESAFVFWKDELKQHLYSEDRRFLEDYPDNYFYFASLWHVGPGKKVVLLEKQH